MKKIAEGAEADIFKLKFMGLDAVLKYRRAKPYLEKSLYENIRTSRTKNEAKMLYLAVSEGASAPKPIFVSRYAICMEAITGTRLDRILAMRHAGSIKAMHGIGVELAILHSSMIAHGDYTPANIIVDKNMKVYVIDFGLSEYTFSLEDKAIDLLLMKRSLIEKDYRAFIESYRRHLKDANKVIAKLEEIEQRGRYQNRSLDHASH